MSNANAHLMKRDDYKAVKHMNREEMTAYLTRVYRRGYEAGCKATMKNKVAGNTVEKDKSDSAPES